MENPYAAPAIDEHLDDVPAENLHGFVLASRWRRFFAALIDNIFFTACLCVPLIFTTATGVMIFDDNVELNEEMLLVLVLAVVMGFLFYCIINIFFIHKRSQTVGKLMLSIRVVTKNFERISTARYIFIRSVPFSLISVMPGGSLLNLIDALLIFRENRNCLHDELAGSLVVNYEPISDHSHDLVDEEPEEPEDENPYLAV